MALPAMVRFREHRQKVHEIGPAPTGMRLDVHDSRAPARDRETGAFDDETCQLFGSQSGPGPSTIDGVGRVQISVRECGDGLEHRPSMTHQEIEVGRRREAHRGSDHAVASRGDINPLSRNATLNKVDSRLLPRGTFIWPPSLPAAWTRNRD